MAEGDGSAVAPVGPEVELPPDDLTLSVEMSLRRLVMLMRGLGWLWMLLLVIATLTTDAAADKTITVGAMALATTWTAVTWWAHLQGSRLGSAWFALADGAVAFLVASASFAADAGDLFHGGYPISWMAVLAYGGGLRWALGGSLLLAVHQATLILESGGSKVSAIGSIVFVVYAVILGWLMGVIRRSDRQRRVTVDELTSERAEGARREERLELANRLHDSVLQTLQVIETDADRPARVRALSRKQSRELRAIVDGYSGDDVATFKSLLHAAIADVEVLYPIEVRAVIRADCPADDGVIGLVEAAREALTNAGKHADVEFVNVYADVEGQTLRLYVRDEGEGFDQDSVAYGHGILRSIRERLENLDGTATISSTPGDGTEVVLTLPRRRVSA